MKIVMKGIPPSCNQYNGRGQWAYREAKQVWTHTAWAACLGCKDRPTEPWKHALVEIDYYFPDRRRRDEDNYSGKLFMDGLTKAGVIADDNFFVIEKRIRAHIDRKNPRTEVTITEVSE